MGQFNFERWGNKRSFDIGQKVECISYHEYANQTCAYQRPLMEILFDKPFKPVKFGVVMGDAGIHPFYGSHSKERIEQYLFVKFSEYKFPKAIPISCIVDCIEAAKNYERVIYEFLHQMGERGVSYETLSWHLDMLNKAKSFVAEDCSLVDR